MDLFYPLFNIPAPAERENETFSFTQVPLAQCNNGDPAVYYRPEVEDGDQPPKKILIYLKGGGVCFPNADDFKVFILSIT